MSGSEAGTIDTDFLVSIPPDYFSVHTPESGEKIDGDQSYGSVYVLNDVPTARLRSSVDLTRLYSSVNLNAYKTCDRPCCSSEPRSTSATIKSYFDTSYVTGKSKFCDDEEPCAATVKDGSDEGSSTIRPKMLMGYPIFNGNIDDLEKYFKEPEKHDKKKDFLQEVDEYLEEVGKHDKKDLPSIIVDVTPEENNHIMNRFLRDDMERVKSIDVDSKSETDSFKYDIQQVDDLLKKMESTQSEMENKLKPHDKNGTCTKKLTSVPGDYSDPIPNVGFGISEACKSPESYTSKSDKQKNQINEERLDSTCKRSNLRESRLYEHGVGSDKKQVPISNCSAGLEMKNVGKTQLSTNAFRKTSTFCFNNRELLSQSLQTKQNLLTKEPAVKVQEFHGQNKTDGGKHLLGINADLYGLEKPENNSKEILNPSGLLSLSDLWTKDKVTYTDESIKYKQKYEEERYRRQHCEQMIHKMQYQILEQQEKLAVAIQVDQGKDKTIQQIRESWQQLTKHWSELENQRHKLEEELEKEKCLSKKNELEISKKVERLNVEIAQALDLAAGYKKKSEMMNLECETLKKEMDETIKEMHVKLVSLDAENKQNVSEKKKLIEELEEVRRELAEEKCLIHDTHIELKKTQDCVSELKAELATMAIEKEKCVTSCMEEQTHSRTLELQISTMQQALTDARRNEKQAVDKTKTYDQRLDAVRSELRVFYQRQLETVVKEKVKEFQDQLDSSELALKVELQTKEKQFSDKAINQCKIYAERHKKEITKMGERFNKEMDTMRTKLAECEEKRMVAENRLKSETQRRKEIPEKLQPLMEKQWKKTLKIISNVSTGENIKNNHPNNKIQEHTIKRSDTSVDVTRVTSEESSSSSSVTFIEDDIVPIRKGSSKHLKNNDMPTRINLRNLDSPRRSSRCSTCDSEDIPFGKDGLTTCRPAYEKGIMKPTDQGELKNYIQMLLKRSPGNPLEDNSGNKAYNEIFANYDARRPGLENLN